MLLLWCRFSWIHVDDLVSLIYEALVNPNYKGKHVCSVHIYLYSGIWISDYKGSNFWEITSVHRTSILVLYNNKANRQKLFACELRYVQAQKHREHNYNINKFSWDFFLIRYPGKLYMCSTIHFVSGIPVLIICTFSMHPSYNQQLHINIFVLY